MINVQYLPPGNAHGLSVHPSVGPQKKMDRGINSIGETEFFQLDTDPCTTFWRAALLQQVKDARNKPRNTAETQIRDAALLWLRGGKDFEMVCDFADLIPEQTLIAIHDALERGVQFRLPKGEHRRTKKRKGKLNG